MKLLFAIICILMLNSCCTRNCDYPVMGADEFVIDSYKIRQGKLAILEMEGNDPGCLPEDAMDEYVDVIVEDDILNIAVYHPSRKDLMESIQFINETVGGFKVTEGKVDIPDIRAVTVAGLTLDEARAQLRQEFSRQIKDVEVFVNYKDRLTRKVELTGLVKTPTVPVDGKIRLYEVIAKAGLPPNANLHMSYVLREGRPLAIDLHQLINRERDQRVEHGLDW